MDVEPPLFIQVERSDSIRELEKIRSESMARHHKLCAQIDKRIGEIRAARGTKLKKWDPSHDINWVYMDLRNQRPTNGWN